MTQENDIVLIYFEEKPLIFARIEDISPDMKKDWYQVKLLILQVPLQTATWILKQEYINGEPFTMGGKRMQIERVIAPEDRTASDNGLDEHEKPNTREEGKVISFSDLKKK